MILPVIKTQKLKHRPISTTRIISGSLIALSLAVSKLPDFYTFLFPAASPLQPLNLGNPVGETASLLYRL